MREGICTFDFVNLVVYFLPPGTQSLTIEIGRLVARRPTGAISVSLARAGPRALPAVNSKTAGATRGRSCCIMEVPGKQE